VTGPVRAADVTAPAAPLASFFPGYFAMVMATGIIATALIAVVVRVEKPGIAQGINGTWFLLTVSTESICVLGALLLPRLGGEALAFTCLAFFCLGIVLYLIVMTMVFLRWTFAHLGPEEEDPPTWIAAGAVAITVLAGSNLLLARSVNPRVDRVAPAIELLVVLAWSTATFWIPLMIAVGVWRHVINRLSLRYHPSFWALVFPVGMYAVATFRMRLAIDLGPLAALPAVALALALLAWTATFAGLVHHCVRLVRRGSRDNLEPPGQTRPRPSVQGHMD
jgi:tellurite resistance protein TehA-like permease